MKPNSKKPRSKAKYELADIEVRIVKRPHFNNPKIEQIMQELDREQELRDELQKSGNPEHLPAQLHLPGLTPTENTVMDPLPPPPSEEHG